MPAQRLNFLDNLRAIVVLLVIALHTAIAYMAGPPQWWYVIDPQNSLFFTGFVLVADVPLMLIMFFLAGFFAYPSLARRGAAAFIRDKLLRLGAPWIAGIFVFAPLVTYLIYVSRDIPVPFTQFYTVDFWGPLYQQSVYWFLGVLLAHFLAMALVYHLTPEYQNRERQPGQPAWLLFAVFWLVGSAWFFAMNQIYPPDTWTSAGKILLYQPERVLLYGMYFSLGVYADRRNWLRPSGYAPGKGWILAALLSGAAYLAQRMIILPGYGETLWAKWLTAGLFNAYCLSALMAGIAFFRLYLNRDRFPWGSLAASSYGIYYLHPLILYPLTYLFLNLPVTIFVKAGLLFTITASLSWLGSARVLKKAPITRAIF